MSPSVRQLNRLAADRLDVVEPAPMRRGCNARGLDGRRCGRLVVERRAQRIGFGQLCRFHAREYAAHRRILQRILDLPARRSDRLT